MGQRHGLGRLLRAAREQHDGRLVRGDVRKTAAHAARPEPHGQQRPQPLEEAYALTEVFKVHILGPFDRDGGAVDERPRGDDVGEVHEPGGVGQVGGAGRPVEDHRQLARQRQAEQGHVAGGRRRQQQAHVRRRNPGEALGHQQHADEHPFVGQHAGQVVGGRHVSGRRQGARHERRGDRVALDLQRRIAGDRPEPCGRRRFGRPLLDKALRQRPHLAEVGRHLAAGETEPLFDLQHQLRAVEAVEAELIEGGVRPLLLLAQGTLQLVRDEMVDGLLRLRLDLAQIDLAQTAELRKLEPARAEEEMRPHEDGLRPSPGVVPTLEPGVDLLAPQFRQPGAIQPLHRNIHLPPGSEEEEIGEKQADAGEQQPRQVRLLAREGVAEAAAPDAGGAHEDDGRFRRPLQNVGQGAGAAQHLDAAALDAAGRPEDEALAPFQTVDDGVHRHLGLFARLVLAWTLRSGTDRPRSSFMKGHRSGLRYMPS